MSSTGSRTRAGTSAIDDITARGAAAVADIGEKGREALQGARDVRDTLADAVLNSIKARPYTTLAIAGLIGFAYGALRPR
jgi:ElaB/YqjD/DUF883 family membrane-anchored ribosome-binding protein